MNKRNDDLTTSNYYLAYIDILDTPKEILDATT